MTTSPAIQNKCIACGATLDMFGRRGSYTYACCQSCGSIQLDPFPSKEELDRAYREDYPTSGHQGSDPIAILETSRPFYEAIVGELRALAPGPNAVLDLGCGWGGLCHYLKSAGYDYLGIDYPSDSLDYCRRQNLNVRAATLDELAGEERRFSAVVMNTVFEHLHDHEGTLHCIHRILKPGGLLLILIPTAGLFGRLARMIKWIGSTDEIPAMNTTFCPPWHTVIFSVKGMHHLLAANGFELVSVRPSPSGSSPGLVGLLQKAATLVAQTGFSIFGARWPLVLNHLLIYRAQ